MQKQSFYYWHKVAKFEYRDETDESNSTLESIKKLLSSGNESDWKNAIDLFLKLLEVHFVPANLDIEQSDTPFKDIKDWSDEIEASNVDVQRFGWDDNDELPWVTYIATFELPVNPVFSSNDELSNWQENNDLLNFACTADLFGDGLEGYCSSDEGSSFYINE